MLNIINQLGNSFREIKHSFEDEKNLEHLLKKNNQEMLEEKYNIKHVDNTTKEQLNNENIKK